MDWVLDATCTFDESGDGRSRTYFADKILQNQGLAYTNKTEIEPSSWHFGGSSADPIPSLSELRCLLGVDGADGRPLFVDAV